MPTLGLQSATDLRLGTCFPVLKELGTVGAVPVRVQMTPETLPARLSLEGGSVARNCWHQFSSKVILLNSTCWPGLERPQGTFGEVSPGRSGKDKWEPSNKSDSGGGWRDGQGLRALAVLAENPGLVPSTNMVAHTSSCNYREFSALSCLLRH